MRWLLGCGSLFVLALLLFVVPAGLEGPVLVPISPGHGLSLVDVVALAPLLAGTGLLAGGLWGVGRCWPTTSPGGPGSPGRAPSPPGWDWAAGRVGVRLLLVVGDRRRAADGDAVRGRPGGVRERGRSGAIPFGPHL